MTTLSEIDQEKNFIKAGILEHHWWGERRLPVVCNRREVMLYIERLEAALQEIANNTCCSTCQEAKLVAQKALAQHEREEAR